MTKRDLEVIDYSFGNRKSDKVDTTLPFTENYKETRTLQGANVVIAAYVNDNFNKINEVNTKYNQQKTAIEEIDTEIESIESDITDINTDITNINTDLSNKQNTLISGSNIKTVNNNSLLGSGNIDIQSGVWGNITGTLSDQTDLNNILQDKANMEDIPTKVSELTNDSGYITNDYHDSTKQDTLISGTNIKTINNNSILTSGNITVPSLSGSYSTSTSSSKGYTCKYLNTALDSKADSSSIPTKTSDLTNDSNFIDNTYHDSTKQDTLVSGTNIKTINNTDILGEGNIDIAGGSDWTYLGNSTGQYNWIVLSSNWKELLCYIKVGSVSRNLYVHILRDVIQYVDADSNGNKTFGTSAVALTGSSTSTTVQGGTVAYKVSTNSISVNYVPGYTGVSTIYVYYK